MTEHTLNLPENIYQQLLLAAQSQGMSPAQWIATQLPSALLSEPSDDFPEDLIGSIDSGAEPNHPDEMPPVRKRDLLGEYVVEKMAKQGIHLP